MARTRVVLPPNIPRMGEVPTRTGIGGIGDGDGDGAGAAAVGGGTGRGTDRAGGGGSSTGGIAKPASVNRGGGAGAGAGRTCARRARCALRRMLEITPTRTTMTQMIAPMSCIAYLGGCGGCVTSGEPPPSTLFPMESRMPVSACRFLRR